VSKALEKSKAKMTTAYYGLEDRSCVTVCKSSRGRTTRPESKLVSEGEVVSCVWKEGKRKCFTIVFKYSSEYWVNGNRYGYLAEGHLEQGKYMPVSTI